MRSRWLLGLVFGLLLVVVLVVNAPARLLLDFLPEERLVLQGVSGTLWRGSASRALVASRDDWLHLGQIRWRLSPFSLLLFSPRVALESAWGPQQLDAEVVLHSSHHVELEEVDALFDAGLLRRYLPVALSGSVALQFQRLVIREDLPEQAIGRLVWQDAGWLSPQGRRNLGSYVLEVNSAEGGTIAGEVMTLEGDVLASGPAVLQQNEYRTDVLISGPGLDDPQLRQALQLVAVPEGDAFRVKLEGKL